MAPKTCYCQQQSSQYPIFPSQARDQSFTRVARNETKYEKILEAADFPSRENCSFKRLNDALRNHCSKQPKKNSKTTHYESRVQSNKRLHFKLTYRENYGNLCGRLIASDKLIKVHLLQPIQYIFGTN